jgi:hypothetical protein
VLEESNILLYTEGLRCVRCLAKLFKKQMPPTIAKHFFLLVLDKLRGRLSKQHQSTVFSVLEDLLLYECLGSDLFIEMVIQQIESGKNMGIRIGCVKWLKDSWLNLNLAI